MVDSSLILPAIGQVGIVVKDARKKAANYSKTFGIGPFTIHEIDMAGSIYLGKPATGHLRIAICQAGPIEMELIEVLEGGEFYLEFLRTKGEGMHHLGIHIDDPDTYDKLLDEFARKGIYPILSRRGHKISAAYLDTQAISGTILELIHMQKA